MDNCKVLPLDARHNNEMLSILRLSPIQANGMQLFFDKSPDIFEIPRMKYPSGEVLGFFIADQLKGFAALGYYDAWVKGQVEKVFTFYHFYLLPEARGRQISTLAMKMFFEAVRKTTANYGITITMKGNRATESYIGQRVGEWMPPSRVIDELVVKTIVFSKSKRNTTPYPVRSASTEDIPSMVKLLQAEHGQRDFGIVFGEGKFRSSLQVRQVNIEDYYVSTDVRGKINGVALAWDCSRFRRTTVMKFSPAFYPTLWGYKFMSAFLPLANFPEKGESFRELTITDYAVQDRDPVIMHALLSEIYFRNNNRKYHYLNWASCGSDSLLHAANGFWHRNLVSLIAFTSLDPVRYAQPCRLPYIDIGFI